MDHTVAKPMPINNEKFVNKSVNEVWDNLVKELSKSFFVINNIDKESRIINVSFYSDTPEVYIDCGTTDRTWSFTDQSLKKVKGGITYKTSEDSKHIVAGAWTRALQKLPYVGNIIRKTSLEGRMNIYVAPSGNGTLALVNCRYIFKCDIATKINYMNEVGTVIRTDQRDDSWENVFNTKKPNTKDLGNGHQSIYVTCCSNGKLEQEILSFVK
ncbi:MAG: hypothetical protein ACW964_18010 [Candidatus Hodarchaeales archaeon]|jgi:hypothetical protein